MVQKQHLSDRRSSKYIIHRLTQFCFCLFLSTVTCCCVYNYAILLQDFCFFFLGGRNWPLDSPTGFVSRASSARCQPQEGRSGFRFLDSSIFFSLHGRTRMFPFGQRLFLSLSSWLEHRFFFEISFKKSNWKTEGRKIHSFRGLSIDIDSINSSCFIPVENILITRPIQPL